MENNIFYNYVYLDPRKLGDYNYDQYHFDYEPFYVGKGSNGRYKKKHGRDCTEIISEIKLSNLEHICVLLYEKISEDDAFDMEKVLIKTIGRKDLGLGPLLNKSDGGKLPFNVIITDEIREKLSKANKGKKFTEEHKRNLSEAKKGEKHPMYGKHHTDETRQKLSELRKGEKHTDETRRKISEAKKGEKNHFYGKHHTEETKRKISKSLKLRRRSISQ